MAVVHIKELVFFLLFSQSLILKCYFATNSFKFKVRKNFRFNTESVLERIRTKSHLECAAICSARQDCVSTSFKKMNEPEENCFMSTKATIDDLSESPGIPEGLEFEAGWKTWSQIKYPVYHALGNYSRFTMTFEQAKQLCEDYGTTIATKSDLLYARQLGFAYCACCWLSDGTKGFVLQVYTDWCSSVFHDGIIDCSSYQEHANVFCKTD